MSAGVIVSFGLYSYYKRKTYLYSVCGFTLVLLLTTSKTSLASCIIALCFYVSSMYLVTGAIIFAEKRHPVRLRVMIVSVFVIVGAFLIYFLVPYAVELLDRDLTFSGRWKIWRYAMIISGDYNWLGSGYRTFWIDSVTWDFFYYNPYWDKETGNGHSGYLDVFVELGYVGLVLLFWFIGSYLRGLFRGFKQGSIITYISGPLLVFLIIYNLFETVFLSQRMDVLWLLLILFYLSNSKDSNKYSG